MHVDPRPTVAPDHPPRCPLRQRGGAIRHLLSFVSVGLVLLSAVQLAQAELGWREAEYVKHFGKAIRSPMVQNEAQFTTKGGSLVVIFVDGRSSEEAWLLTRDDRSVPAHLLEQARAAVKRTLKKRVDFRSERVPPAEMFEAQFDGVTVQVDQRRGAIARIGCCHAAQPCTLLDRLLAMERTTDDLVARTQARLKQENRR